MGIHARREVVGQECPTCIFMPDADAQLELQIAIRTRQL